MEFYIKWNVMMEIWLMEMGVLRYVRLKINIPVLMARLYILQYAFT